MFIKGVNLGNWLVLEKWMSPALFEGTDAEDEYYLPSKLPQEVYEARIRVHRSEYISERDFVYIKSLGLHVVRIPVPYFVFGDCPPFLGCTKELDRAFAWAEAYGLSILLDMHTAPESQNGFDNGGISGVCKWAQKEEHVEFTLQVLEKLAERYGTRKGLWGIEILNEPITERLWNTMDVQNRYLPVDSEKAKGSGPIPLAFIQDFYIRAYRRIRKYLPEDKAVVIHDAFEPFAWKDFMREEEFKHVVLDVHLYLMMAEMSGCQQTLEDYEAYIQEHFVKEVEEMQQYFPVICGEWCIFNSYTCGGDTKGGQNPLNGVTAGEQKRSAQELKEAYQRISKAQMKAWEKGSGYFYWNYKLLLDTVNEPNWYGWDSWDFGRCVANEWLL